MPHATYASYRPDIDGLRAVSVVGVLIYHLNGSWLPGGFAGVDVFFVISGYLITSIIARETDEGRFSFLTFYERRIRRIFPSLIVVLAATTLAAWYILLPVDFRTYGRVLAWTPAFASNFALMDGGDYFAAAARTRALLHTWSLGVEEQFYIVFPWLLILARRFSLRRDRLVLGISAVSLAGSFLAAAFLFSPSFYLLPTRFWELGAGALLALAPPTLTERWRQSLAVAGLGLILASFAVLTDDLQVPGWSVLPAVLGAAAVITGSGSYANRMISARPFVFIGRISYPMYLWHWPLVAFYTYITEQELEWTGAALVSVVTVLLSYVTLVFAERPIRTRSILASRSQLFAICAALSGIVILIGVVIFMKKGVVSRFGDADRKALEVLSESPLSGLQCEKGAGLDRDFKVSCRVLGAKPGHIDFAIIGDSHSQAVARSVLTRGSELGLNGVYLGRPGCRPWVGMDVETSLAWRCSSHLDYVLNYIDRENIGAIIIVSRWSAAAKGFYSAEKVGSPTYEKYGKSVSLDDAQSVILSSSRELLQRLSGRTVYAMMTVPEYQRSLARQFIVATKMNIDRPHGMTREEYNDQQAHVRAYMKNVFDGWSVTLLEPADILCASGVCEILKDGVFLYQDGDHLASAGSEFILPIFEPAFRQMLQAKRLAPR
jgi:peptidoglycan/LPS O-acetylase OafA/YrhL